MMTKSRRFTALIFICLAELLVVLDNTVVNVALPTMSVDLFASVSDLQWIVDAYTLTFAGFLLTFGHLGDRFGRRRVMIIGLIGVGAMSLVGALASNLEQVIMARAAMGVFAAAVFPATLAMITNIFTDARERAIAIAAWTAMAGFAIAIGPTAGGWLLEHFSWHSVFWMNVPAALLVIVGVLLVVPESKALHVGRFDFVGTILSLLGIVILVWTIIDAPHRGWVSPFSITGYLSATVLLAAFVAWELRTDAPILNMNLFRILRSATSACSGSCS
jgi:DHA2 family multidrug resistance protein-like MFS transporter